MDSLYEDIEVVSEGEDESEESIIDFPPSLNLRNSNNNPSDRLSSPPGKFDNYFTATSPSSEEKLRSPSVPNFRMNSPNSHQSEDDIPSKNRLTQSTPNLTNEAHLEQLRFIHSMNFCQNFSSIVNDQLDENYSWIDSIGDYYRYGDKEKYIEPTKLPNIELSDHEISSYLEKVEELYNNYEKSKIKPNYQSSYYESELESSHAMDIAINRELIPFIYFEGGFDLGNIQTFQQIFSEEAMSTSLLLQEKLSHYLDRTEVLLTQQVSFRSAKIFDAFFQYNQLDDDLQVAIPLVKELRQKIKDIDSICSKTPLEVTALVRRKQNLKKTLGVLKVVYAIQQGQEIIDELIEKQDFLSALELINETREVLKTEFASMKCFRNLGDKLNDKTIEIQSKAQNLFISKLIEGYISIFEELNTSEKTLKDHASCLVIDNEYRAKLESELQSVVKPIICVTDTQFVIHKYREKLLAFLNERLATAIDKKLESPKQSPIQHHTSNNSSKSNSLEQSGSKYLGSKNIQVLRSVPTDQYIAIIHDLVYRSLTLLQKSMDISSVLFKLLEDVQDNEKSKAGYVLREFEKINSTITELVHTRLSLIVSLRGESSIVKNSTKTELLNFMDICFTFIENSERIIGKKVNFLKGTLQAVGKTFLEEFNKQHLDSLKTILEKENWIWVENIQPKHQENVNIVINNSSGGIDTKTADSKHIIINGELFPVCGSFLHLVKMTRNFLELLSPEHYKFISTFDVSTRICNLFGTFNIEVKNLILKAGAINAKSGLKTITAKHLVLTSEVLGATNAFVLQVKLNVEKTDPQLKGKLGKFDELLMDLKEHKKSIYQKLYDIMKDVLETHAKEIIKFDWDNGQKKDSPFSAILKALLSVYKVLNTYLGNHLNDLRGLFTKIVVMYSSRMKTGLQSLQKIGLSRRAIKNIKDEVVLVSKQFKQFSDSIFDDFDLEEVENCFNDCFVVALPIQTSSETQPKQ